MLSSSQQSPPSIKHIVPVCTGGAAVSYLKISRCLLCVLVCWFRRLPFRFTAVGEVFPVYFYLHYLVCVCVCVYIYITFFWYIHQKDIYLKNCNISPPPQKNIYIYSFSGIYIYIHTYVYIYIYIYIHTRKIYLTHCTFFKKITICEMSQVQTKVCNLFYFEF